MGRAAGVQAHHPEVVVAVCEHAHSDSCVAIEPHRFAAVFDRFLEQPCAQQPFGFLEMPVHDGSIPAVDKCKRPTTSGWAFVL